jgi:hypothetical protein
MQLILSVGPLPNQQHAAPAREVVELLACGVLPHHKTHLAAVGFDHGAAGSGGRLPQQTSIPLGVTPEAPDVSRPQPPLDEGQVAGPELGQANG